MVKKAENYRWSSAQFRVKKEGNKLLSNFFLVDDIKDWSEYLRDEENEKQLIKFRYQSSSGRPLGDESFLRKLEDNLGRVLIKIQPGPKR